MQLTTNYFKVSNNIFELGLSIQQIVVVTYISRCENNNSKAFPSYTTIAEKCGMGVSTAKRTIKELVELGLLSKVVRKTKGKKCNDTNVYKITNLIEIGIATTEVIDGKEINKIINKSDLNENIEVLDEIVEDTQDLSQEEKDAQETEELIAKFLAGEISVQEQSEEQDLKEKLDTFQVHLNRKISSNLREIIRDLDWGEIVGADTQINENKQDEYVTEKYIINAIYDNKRNVNLKLVK